MKAKVYNQLGKEVKEIELPENIFGLDFNGDLVSQVLYIQRSNQRAGTANTKDRGEVSGSNQKPWQQKGLGRARHGSKRSPIWRHGGITHGPRSEKSYKKDLPKNMKIQALFNLLSAKLKDGKILFVDDIKSTTGKTKDAVEIMKNIAAVSNFENLSFKKKRNVYMTFSKLSLSEKRAFRNLPYVVAHNMEDLNPSDIANARYLVITNPESTVEYLKNKLN
ncbi:MAG: hypothetical protein RI945_368 [Candidatus Parcubacteria bacterium]|jgi:large subunit ribosomal protein L4